MTSRLEILRFPPPLPGSAPPLLFLHGAYAGAWCWVPFMTALAAAGFDVYALSFRGHAGSHGQEKLDEYGIDDYVIDLESVVDSFASPPILVGHSMGGFVAQRYLSRGGSAAGLALLASVPPYGLTGSVFHMGLFYPKLLMDLSQFELGAMPKLDLMLVRTLLFSADMEDAALSGFVQLAQRESTRALLEMLLPQSWAHWSLPKLPALVLGAEDDKLIPPADVWACARALGVEAEFIDGVGHAMMLDSRQGQVLTRLLAWLDATPWALTPET
ncbi:MAG: hypothetical protein H6R07_615 [Proteobacteria bacterium]|nr:hypothetical protein [Pseudomonadota bacterium]